MDFSFSEEQNLLRNTVERFVQENYEFEKRRKIVAADNGWNRDTWTQIAELGLLAAPFSEEQGGLGGGPIDTMLVMEEFGKGLVVDPYLPTVVQAGGFLRRGTAAQIEEHIPGIIGGENVWAFAYAEPQSRYNLADVTTTAKKDGDGFVINGSKAVVLAGPWADKLIVTARTAGGQRDANGITVFIVDKGATGVSTRDYPTVDGSRASEITFENVKVGADAVIGDVDNGLPLVELISDESIAALSAEACGCMKMLVDDTVEYCKTRKQFGVPIGKFQVLQHRLVDMQIECRRAAAIAARAVEALPGHWRERGRLASAAKVTISETARFVGQNAVQLHGAMGMTRELDVGRYFRRLTVIEGQLGTAAQHRARFARLAA